MSKRWLPLSRIAKMMTWASWALFSSALTQVHAQQDIPLQVELIGTQQALQFQQPARLEQVLKQAQAQGMTLQYPLAVTIFDRSPQAEQSSMARKNSVLNQMIQHNLVTHPTYQFIQQSQFAPRVLSGVDVDAIRLDKFANPRLTGLLALSAPAREENVLYLGNLDGLYRVNNLPGIALKAQLNSLASTKEIATLPQPPILIYPDGEVVEPHHGRWLTTQYYLPPLTMVYIPFEDYQTSTMDQDIVQLLSQRIPTATKK